MVEQARADQGKSTRGTLTTEEKEELSRLRKENRELRLEREIFKKAAAFFANEQLRQSPRAPSTHNQSPEENRTAKNKSTRDYDDELK